MNKTISMLSVTVRQQNSITHTKFVITPAGKPFPAENFDMACVWANAGLLSVAAAEFVLRMKEGKGVLLR
jgi:hypothetical protein